MTQLSRRSFLLASSLAAMPVPAWARNLARGQFTHGVASGDPMPDRVILWTRFLPEAGDAIGWEIADDENFTRIVAHGQASLSATTDHCVKVDASGLQPGRRYFYRFVSAAGPSVTGRTLTAPRHGGDALTIALFSCANMPYGYFHAYGDAAADDSIDLVLHVGDYTYEYPRGEYPDADEAVAARVIEPANEVITLADHYARYASYHTDADLLELRRLKPISAVWDDHEFANDTWREGAQNHQPATEGAWADRVAGASKAYFDWMPIRRPERNGVRIYRSLDWGDLARIVLIDTRLIGRDHQLDYRAALGPAMMGQADMATAVAAFRQTLDDPHRTIMGQAQERWFANALAQSKARGQPWQIVAQQIVMEDLAAPRGITRLLDPTMAPIARQYYMAGETVSAAGLPWNLDAWGGYPAARDRFLSACATQANNAVVLGGDSHNAWVGNLASPIHDARLAALEFAGGSVTSPGFEKSLSNAQPGERESTMKGANPQLAFCDMTNKGYGVLRFTRDACNAEWRAVSDIKVAQRGPTSATKLVAQASTSGPQAWAMA